MQYLRFYPKVQLPMRYLFSFRSYDQFKIILSSTNIPTASSNPTQEATLRKSHLFVLVCLFASAGSVVASNFVATSLNNVVVGGQWSQRASIRFQAKSNAPLAGARLYWVIGNPPGKSGYVSGSGGKYVYSLREDANGQPGAILSTASMIKNQITENQRGDFPLICFPPTSLVSGQYYDIVVENTDPDASLNWSSLDFLWEAAAANQTPDVEIWVSDENEAFKKGDAGTFIGSPVALFYADGTIQGHGDIAVSPSSASGLECGSEYGFPAVLCQ
jgi:hypothetical protein